MEFRVNKIDPNVLGQFKQIKSDEGLWLVRFKEDKPANVTLSGVKTDWQGNQSIAVEISRENREIDAIVSIARSSTNYYTVSGIYKGKTKSQRCSSIDDVSNYLKQNFCKTLLG